MFICNHCPFVKHLKKGIVKLSNFYMKVYQHLVLICFLYTSDNLYKREKKKGKKEEELQKITGCIKWFLLLVQKGLAVVAISSNSTTTHPQVQMTL